METRISQYFSPVTSKKQTTDDTDTDTDTVAPVSKKKKASDLADFTSNQSDIVKSNTEPSVTSKDVQLPRTSCTNATNQSKSNENDICQSKQQAKEAVMSVNNSAHVITKATVGKITVERAPLSNAAKPRCVPVVFKQPANRKNTGWKKDRYINRSKLSVHQWLQLKVGCHKKDHGKEYHVCKKGKTFEECGVYTDKGKLFCCGRPRVISRSALTNHVHKQKHDEWQVSYPEAIYYATQHE